MNSALALLKRFKRKKGIELYKSILNSQKIKLVTISGPFEKNPNLFMGFWR